MIENDRDKLWVKIIFKKKRCGFTTVMEAMSAFSFEFININVTTSKGAMLVSSCVKVIKNMIFCGTFLSLLRIVKNISMFITSN